MIVILLGPPGSGKGTHAPRLSSALQIPHISTGDLLRTEIRKQSEIGKLVQGYIDEGHLVPDEIVIEMLLQRCQEIDCKKGFILDGVPRTLSQAQNLQEKFGSSHEWIVLSLEISEDLLVERICGRIVCSLCSSVFHKRYMPPKFLLLCDQCGGPLFQRSDDKEEIVRERLVAYHRQTQPLIEYYKTQSHGFYAIDASRSKEEVAEEILSCLVIK